MGSHLNLIILTQLVFLEVSCPLALNDIMHLNQQQHMGWPETSAALT